MFKRMLLLGLPLLMLISLAQAVTRHDLDDPRLAARINGIAVSMPLLALMQRITASQNPEAGAANDVLQTMVDDRLLAAYARERYPQGGLIEDNKVAFSPVVQRRQALVSALQLGYRAQLEAAIKKEKGGSLDALVLRRHDMRGADWQAVFGATPKMLLEYALDENGRRAAEKIILLSYRLDAKTRGQISFADVYDAQNVQGRHQLHARDSAFAAQQATVLLGQVYVLHWTQTRSGLSAADYRLLQEAVDDRLIRNGWMMLIGISSDIHDDPAHLKALAAAVSPEEIRSYYEQNREEFRRIEKVRARHIRLADEKTAQAVYERLQKGEAFAALAASTSMADDRASGGDLGWIVHGDKQLDWLQSLAFVQKTGVASRPFRTPGKPGSQPAWEILLTEERVEGYQPAESESVRYVAAQAIARRKALAEYRDTLIAVRAQADIRINPALRLDGEVVLPEAGAHDGHHHHE